MDEDERSCPSSLLGGLPAPGPDRAASEPEDPSESRDEPDPVEWWEGPDPAEWAEDAAEPWEAARPRFGQGDEADVLPPGPPLAGLTEEAVMDLDSLSDDELIGVLQATRRQMAREQYKQVLVTAEFARRRQAAFEDAARQGVPVGCRPGGFPGEELTAEMVVTPAEAGHRIDDAIDLTTRLPRTLAGMAAGEIDLERAGWIAVYTRSLSPADTAAADEILARVAPELRPDQVARRAAAMEMRLAPEAVKARRERVRRNEQRVEARREWSGNACLSGREMDTADVMASKAHLDAVAIRLRKGGLPGTLGALRVLALADLTQGRNPLDRLRPADLAASRPADPPAAGDTSPSAPGGPGPGAQPGRGAGSAADPGDPCRYEQADFRDDPDYGDSGNSYRGPGRVAEPVEPNPDDPAGHRPAPGPVPAQVNLIIPVGTLLGWSTAPAQAGAWGLLDVDEARATATAAARHPLTRWCATLTGPDGTALAHACARGQRPELLTDLEPQPPPGQLAELLRRLNLTFSPIADGGCDHSQAEANYAPSRKLKHLVRARTATCDAPGCQAQALTTDLDHTTPWPEGPTDQCNLAPRCRRHHRAKQAPDWKVDQLTPGVTRWTLPSGRTHTTTPTRYDV